MCRTSTLSGSSIENGAKIFIKSNYNSKISTFTRHLVEILTSFAIFEKCLLKSVHFKKTVAQSSFLSKVLSFRLTLFYFSENDNTFERNEDCATVFLKWPTLAETSLHHSLCFKLIEMNHNFTASYVSYLKKVNKSHLENIIWILTSLTSLSISFQKTTQILTRNYKNTDQGLHQAKLQF